MHSRCLLVIGRLCNFVITKGVESFFFVVWCDVVWFGIIEVCIIISLRM